VCAAVLCIPVIVKSRTKQVTPVRTAFAVLSGSVVRVKISGAVSHPGIYNTSANILATSVMKMAVPECGQGVSMASGNSSPLVQEGDEINVRRESDGHCRITVGHILTAERLVLGMPLVISDMNEADFDRLPGIGPALARRIVQYRQNNGGRLRVDDLAMVEGIGEKKFLALCTLFQGAENKR
jgi:competence protein ComEA